MRKTCLLLSVILFMFFSGSGALAAPPQIDWTKYHNHADVTQILKDFAAEYPNLCKMYSIGKSFQGKDIWCLEMTNYATGEPEMKPGVYIDGNTHAGEVSGGEVCLYIINRLLTGYGRDSDVTELLDRRVFYILPKINPDGSDIYLRDPNEPPDPNYRKVDDDDDGLLDEDPVEDLNKDGIINLMRIRDDDGSYRTHPEDPRLMVERKAGEKGEWRILGTEGIDNDKDGRLNEDPPGRWRTVSNRNYPAYWAPEWIQSNAGPYPLSEPEAKAQVDFILAHPNIAGTQAFHTHSGVLLRPYCNLTDDAVPPEDIRAYQAAGDIGTELTGYTFLSLYHGFTPDKSNPRHGVFIDWAYDHFGAFAWITEIWKAPGELGRSAFEEFDEVVAMEWNDKELGGKGFINWQKYDHPEFGEIEIGGWNGNTFSQNPPPKFAEAEWKKNCDFELERAAMLPYLQIADIKTESLGNRLVRIAAKIVNEAYLPTHVVQIAIKNGIAKPVVVKLELEGAEILSGDPKTEVGHIKGTAPRVQQWYDPSTGVVNYRDVEWVVRLERNTASATVTAVSQKAGTASKQIGLRAN
jgi:hypothetical protein